MTATPDKARAATPQDQLSAYFRHYYPGLVPYLNWKGGATGFMSEGVCCVFVHSGIGLVGGHLAIVRGQQKVVGLHAEAYTMLPYVPKSHLAARRICFALWRGLSHLDLLDSVTAIEVFARAGRDHFVDQGLRIAKYPC